MLKRLVLSLSALALLAGCDGASDPERVFTTMVVAPERGTAGPLKLGMSPEEAVKALGEPESRYHDFLSWRGGKVTAVVREGHLESIRIADPAVSIQGFHVGSKLEEAQKTFPGGEYEQDEVPVYELPGVKYAWFEILPSVEQEVLAVVLSSVERQDHHD